MHQLRTSTLDIDLILLEMETERYPSFAASLSICMRQGGGVITYHADDIWFEIDAWQRFAASLRQQDSPCTISDLSNDVLISMTPAGLRWKVALTLRRLVGDSTAAIDFGAVTGFELHQALLDFARSVARDARHQCR